MKPTWKYLLYALIIIATGGVAYVIIETVKAKNTGFEVKTLWDWMQLLIVPLALAGGAFFLNRAERTTEREIATDRQQEATLQAYIDRISDLLLKEKLRTAKRVEVRDVARTRTLTVLRRLDGWRKGLVVQFLYEAGLISNEKPIVDLAGADLRGAELFSAALNDANLSNSDLSFAHLSFAHLSGADLTGANLTGTDLFCAELEYANLSFAILRDTDLTRPSLNHADLSGADLSGANLNNSLVDEEKLKTAKSLIGATMPDGTIHE